MISKAVCSGSIGICAALFLGCGLLAGCGSNETSDRAEAEPASPAASSSPAPGSAPAARPVDACTLLTKADVETIAGKPVLEGYKEEAGPLVACSFGDPDVPLLGGRSTSHVLTIDVMTGDASTYAGGAAAQVKGAFEMTRKNAASDEPVTGLGDVAYWDKDLRTLNIVSGKYWIGVHVESRDDGLAVAKAAGARVLAKLTN